MSRDRWLDGVVAVAVTAVALWLYEPTLAPGLVWGDGPELAAVAAGLGIAHPTGYPLFTLLAHAFLQVPIEGSVAWRTTLFCALTSALAAGVLTLLLARWSRAAPESRLERSREASSSHGLRLLLAAAGGLVYAAALGPWSQATVTEVYPLQVFLQSLVLLAAWHTAWSGRGLALTVLLFSLALGHHLLAIVLVPVVLAAGSRALARRHAENGDRWRQRRRRQLGVAAGMLVLGALPLLYLPLRAAQRPAINWGDPSTLARWVGHLRGGHYIDELWLTGEPGTPFSGGAELGGHLMERGRAVVGYLLGQVVPPEGLPPWAWGLCLALGLGLLLAGGWRLAQLRSGYALAVGASMVLYLGVVTTYNIHDIVDYQLGLFALLWPVMWLGASGMVRSTPRRRGKLRGPATAGLLLFLLVLPVALAVGNRSVSDRSSFDLGDRYAARLLAPLPGGAILVTRGQYTTSSAWYQQEVLGQRRDVLVVVQDFLGEPWYAATVSRAALAGRVVPPVATDASPGTAAVSTLERLVDANPRVPIFLLASPRQKVFLERRFELLSVATLLSSEEVGEAFDAGFEPPEIRVFQVHPKDGAINSSSPSGVQPIEERPEGTPDEATVRTDDASPSQRSP